MYWHLEVSRFVRSTDLRFVQFWKADWSSVADVPGANDTDVMLSR